MLISLRLLLYSLYTRTYTNPLVARLRLALQYFDKAYLEDRAIGLARLLEEPALRKLEVLQGPFQGMRYPTPQSIGSALFPKLVGTYELELQDAFQQLMVNTYDVIVDVGAAEGYYAVGLAMRLKGTSVIAVDINPAAADLIQALAALNDVEKAIEFREAMTSADLVDLAGSYQHGLLVSDCEGYELQLFTAAAASALRGWDLLIETHDSSDRNITKPLKELLLATHEVAIIRRHGRSLFHGPKISASPQVIRAAMDEGRTWRSCWLYCRAKKN